MFQLFLRTSLRNLLTDRSGERAFKVRSAERDAATDEARIASILTAIETALHDAEKEQAGLNRRVDDALARAAVTLGNDADEYLEREALDSHHQDLFSTEIASGQRRIAELATMISHLGSVKAAMLARFSDVRTAPPDN
jgi:hypothetical protein